MTQTKYSPMSVKVWEQLLKMVRCRGWGRRLGIGILVGLLAGWSGPLEAQDILTSQLRQGFGKNKVRYKDFDWWILESEHLELHYEPEFADLAERALQYLEEGYVHISQVMRHELSTKPPIVIYKSHYDFQQTNIIHEFLPPGVAGFAEPLRYRMVIPFDGDLDNFRNVLVHELMHIFQYDILYKGPIKRISNPLSAPPTWIMEGLAEYVTQERNTIDEMVLRDAILTDSLIPLKIMDAFWGTGNVFLAYKQSHSLMEYIAENYGPEKVSRILRVWDSQNDTDRLLKRLIDMDMDALHERWSAHMRKQYWPMLQSRDYVYEIAQRVAKDQSLYRGFANPKWSLSGDMLAVHSTDGVEQHVDIIRLRDGSLVERITRNMRASDYDQLTFGPGTVAWAPDGHNIAFVAKKGPRDIVLLWDMYDKDLKKILKFDQVEIVESLAWSPDSRQLAFVGSSFGQSDVYLVDVGSGNVRQLTGTPQREDHPAWSPDGTKLAYCAKVDNQFDIKIYDLETDQTAVAIASPTDDLWPNWLPEGNKLLFVSTRDRINDLFVYHLEEGREYQLTRTISGVMDPALAPDGREIVLTTYYKGRRELYRMDMPKWPEVKERHNELLARVDKGAVARSEPAPAAGSGTVPVDSLLVGQLADQSGGAVGKVVALFDQTLREGGEEARSYNPAENDPSEKTEGSPRDDKQVELPLVQQGDETAAPVEGGPLQEKSSSETPRRRYTPKLEFDGVALQMGYFDGFLSSVAQLSMSDLLGNHSLSMATDYVASQDIDNDFNFAFNYRYYGKRPTYNLSIFNWTQFFNDRQQRGFIYRGQLVGGIERSRQTGLLADVSYPLDIYRRIDLSYTFVDEQQELVWPLKENIGSTITHLFKAAYVHDSITYGLLGPTAGRRYFFSAGRTLSLSKDDRSFAHLELDYRQYLRLGRWSVLGLRAYSVSSLGRDELQYNLGGPAWFLPFFSGFNLNTGPLRGYEYSELLGSRVALINAEIRVPFIRNITFGWPGTFAIPAVDGSLFMDVGHGLERGATRSICGPSSRRARDPSPEGEQQLRASVGFGNAGLFYPADEFLNLPSRPICRAITRITNSILVLGRAFETLPSILSFGCGGFWLQGLRRHRRVV